MAGFETLVDLFEQTIEKHPNNRLFGEKKGGRYQWTSYQKFGQKVDAFRGALAARGIGEGDTVAVIADNRLEWAVGAYATYGLGARYCPMYEVQLAKDWKYILEDSDAKIVLVANQDIYEKVKDFADDLDELEHLIFFDGDKEHADYFGNVIEDGKANPCPTLHPDKEQIATFIYTSGTTGNPKGVKLSHWNICSNIVGIYEIFPIDEDEVACPFCPGRTASARPSSCT